MSAPASGAGGNRRRELAAAALLCAAGAALAVAAGGRPWAAVRAQDAITPLTQRLTGRDLAAAAPALGWAGLAGLAALFATRAWARTAVGGLLVAFGCAIGYVSATATGRGHVLEAAAGKSSLLGVGTRLVVEQNAWWVVSLTGGVLLALAGIVTVARGRGWPGLSARYDPAGQAVVVPGGATADPAGLWKSIDRGDDPTDSGG